MTAVMRRLLRACAVAALLAAAAWCPRGARAEDVEIEVPETFFGPKYSDPGSALRQLGEVQLNLERFDTRHNPRDGSVVIVPLSREELKRRYDILAKEVVTAKGTIEVLNRVIAAAQQKFNDLKRQSAQTEIDVGKAQEEWYRLAKVYSSYIDQLAAMGKAKRGADTGGDTDLVDEAYYPTAKQKHDDREVAKKRYDDLDKKWKGISGSMEATLREMQESRRQQEEKRKEIERMEREMAGLNDQAKTAPSVETSSSTAQTNGLDQAYSSRRGPDGVSVPPPSKPQQTQPPQGWGESAKERLQNLGEYLWGGN